MKSGVVDLYGEFRARYGAPRLTREPNAAGIKCSANYVAGIMRAQGIKARSGNECLYFSWVGPAPKTENEMRKDEIKALFDQQAASYDTQWAKTAPIRNCLHLLLGSIFAELPEDANILCVGVGTGDELIYLASQNPGWTFTAVEPSGPMLAICRQRTQQAGVASRCIFYEGYLGSLPAIETYDAATCFLVSQFILEEPERSRFFSEISERLKPNGVLASSDLASDVQSPEYDVLLRAWMNMMSAADISPEAVDRMRKAYANDVGVLPPAKVVSIIESGGFQLPVQFFQSGLIHAWLSKRARNNVT